MKHTSWSGHLWRSSPSILLVVTLGWRAQPVEAATLIDVTVNTAQCAGGGAELVFGFVSGGASSNTAQVINLATDGQRGARRWRGGPVVGSLVGGGGPPYEATIQALGFDNHLIVPMTNLGTNISFSVELTEMGPSGGGIPDQFAFYVLNADGSTVIPTVDPTGADAVFAVGVTGAAGGALEVFVPATLASGNQISLTLCAGGGGGCPFVDTRSARGWQVENSVLGRSVTGALALDAYRLKAVPQVQDGRVQVRIRENEEEYTLLDEARLLAVDRTAGARTFTVGSRVVVGDQVGAFRVTTSSGLDITGLVDGLGGDFFPGEPGDTLLVDMTGTASLGTFGAKSVQDGGGEGGLGGDPKVMEVAQGKGRPAVPMGAEDQAILDASGILLQRPDGQGGWRTVGKYYPREYRDDAVFDSLGVGMVRLIFVGRHRLFWIGRVIRSAIQPSPQDLRLVSAMHSRLGNVRVPVAAAGGATTSLVPGDTLNLDFATTAIPPGHIREWFLVTRGVYSSTALPASDQPPRTEAHMPTRFALRQNRPNPFSGITAIHFDLPAETTVRLEIFDAQGRLVRTLANGGYPAGFHSVEWDHQTSEGKALGAGVYLYRIRAGSFRDQKKMVLLAR